MVITFWFDNIPCPQGHARTAPRRCTLGTLNPAWALSKGSCRLVGCKSLRGRWSAFSTTWAAPTNGLQPSQALLRLPFPLHRRPKRPRPRARGLRHCHPWQGTSQLQPLRWLRSNQIGLYPHLLLSLHASQVAGQADARRRRGQAFRREMKGGKGRDRPA
jgi:hypothetical protein